MTDTTTTGAQAATTAFRTFDTGAGLEPYHLEDATQRAALLAALAPLSTAAGQAAMLAALGPLATAAAQAAILAAIQALLPLNAANVATGQVTLAGTAAQIVGARATRRSVTVINETTTAARFGGASVASGTGALLPGIVGASVTLSVAGALYGIGGGAVSYVEIY